MVRFSHRVCYLAISSLGIYIAADAQITTAPTCPFANAGDQTFNSARGGAWTARCGNPIDINGDDIGLGTQTSNGYAGCIDLCDSTTNCNGVAFVPFGNNPDQASGTGEGTCYMKAINPGAPMQFRETGGSRVAAVRNYQSSALTTASSVSSASPQATTAGAYPPPGDSTLGTQQNFTNSNGQSYAVTGGCDTTGASVPDLANGESLTGWSGCMSQCDAYPACAGFTWQSGYQATNGTGFGRCFYKSGSLITTTSCGSDQRNVAAIKIVSPPAASGPTSSSGVAPTIPSSAAPLSTSPSLALESSTTSPRAPSPPAQVAYGSPAACPSPLTTNNRDQNFTASGSSWAVRCGSDIYAANVPTNANREAPNGYSDCFGFCASTAACDGFTFSGSASGQGAGTCYLKQAYSGQAIVFFNTATVGAFRIQPPPYVSPTSSGSVGPDTAVSLTSTASTATSFAVTTTILATPSSAPIFTMAPGSSTNSSISTSSSIVAVTSSTTISSLAATSASTASTTATACPGIYGTVSGCPADNNKTVTDAAGIQYYIGCGQDIRGQVKNPYLIATDLSACFDRCSSNTGFTDGASGPCHGFTVFQGYCYFQTFDGPQNLVATSAVNAYLRTNYLAGYIAPGAGCTQSASPTSLAPSDSTRASVTSALVPFSSDSTSVRAGSTLSAPELSTASNPSQASSASSSSSSEQVTPGTVTEATSSSSPVNTRQAVATATGRPQFSCPANNQQIVQDNCGVSYIIGCNNETVAGSTYPAIAATTFNDCFSQCSSGSFGVCISWTWFQGFCYLKAPSYGNDRFNGVTQGVVAGINIDYYNTPDRPLPSSTTRACASGVPIYSYGTSRTTTTRSLSAASNGIASTWATTQSTTVPSSSVVPILPSATASITPATGLPTYETILSTSIISSVGKSASLTGSTVLDSTASVGTGAPSMISSDIVESMANITVASTTPLPSSSGTGLASSARPIFATQSSLPSVDQSSTLATSSALSQSSQYPDISSSPSVTLPEQESTSSTSSTSQAESTPPPACPTGSADDACVQISRNSTCVSDAGNTYSFACGYAFTGKAIPDDDVILPPPYDQQPFIPPTETPVARRRSLDPGPLKRTFIFPKRVPLPNIENCQQACDSTPSCQGVNFISYNCTLLSEITGTTPYPGAIVAHQFSNSGLPPESTVATYSQTNIPTSTSVATPATVPGMSPTTTSDAPASTGVSCPADDGRIYTGISGSYYVECNMEIGGLLLDNDLATKHKRQAMTPETCMLGCQIYGDSCVGVNHRPESCIYYGSLNTLSPSEGTLALIKVEAVAGPPTGYPTASSPATTASTSAALSSANSGQSSMLTSDNGPPSGYPGGSSASSISQTMPTGASTRTLSTRAPSGPSTTASPSSSGSAATSPINNDTPDSYSNGVPSPSSTPSGTGVTTGASGGMTSSLSGFPDISSAPPNTAPSLTNTGSPNTASGSILSSAGTPDPSTVTVCKNVRTRTTVVVTTSTLTTCRAEQACGTLRR
ncbi:hypothetical protein CERZMDRAFT_99032 [Cercospora zeae-maydis SCOH1-5]|uniref:Apple domain-containing protein n=1 Tax=Cercospora zeae-maydis SCOH1-5 TaxID=717836 RepID=A0A6A6FC35_9PEZI|nr:hypothetical protein CERZMDRAFT_99032 [Cercospora zeae-maydis SCOH1-5]